MRDVYIFDAVRTPRGRGKAGKGKLSGIHPQELFAQALNHLAERNNLTKEDVEDVIAGCVFQVKEQGACITRNAILAADWPLLRARASSLVSPAPASSEVETPQTAAPPPQADAGAPVPGRRRCARAGAALPCPPPLPPLP